MAQRTKVLAIVIGAIIAIVTIVYIFQPWRSCPYDDSPSACAMLPADAAVMSVAMFGTLVGLVFVALGLFVRRANAYRRWSTMHDESDHDYVSSGLRTNADGLPSPAGCRGLAKS